MNEEEVFNVVTRDLDERGWKFLVDCPYDSVLQKYDRYKMILPGRSKPDILGLTPEGQMFSVEVKGSGVTEVKRGRGQAQTYREGVHLSYLAAAWDALQTISDNFNSIGAIGVSGKEVVHWEEPNYEEIPITSPDIRANLEYQLLNRDSISKIASLNLAHPVNFLAPPVVVRNSHRSLNVDRLRKILERRYDLSGGSINHMIEGSRVLGLIDVQGGNYRISEQGQVAIDFLKYIGSSSIDELMNLKENSSSPDTLYAVEPSLALLLRDRYSEHRDFRALLEILKELPQNSPVTLVEISKRLVRDHPNTFLHLFCTNQEHSLDVARNLIRSHKIDELTDDLDIFRNVIRQNIYQNFTRQLKHLGVLSDRTASASLKLDDYDPKQYPWFPNIKHHDARLSDYGFELDST